VTHTKKAAGVAACLRMFGLARSDCVVFEEHTRAKALSQSWGRSFSMLRRVRYRDDLDSLSVVYSAGPHRRDRIRLSAPCAIRK